MLCEIAHLPVFFPSFSLFVNPTHVSQFRAGPASGSFPVLFITCFFDFCLRSFYNFLVLYRLRLRVLFSFFPHYIPSSLISSLYFFLPFPLSNHPCPCPTCAKQVNGWLRYCDITKAVMPTSGITKLCILKPQNLHFSLKNLYFK